MDPDYRDDKMSKGQEEQPAVYVYTPSPPATPRRSDSPLSGKRERGGCLTVWVAASAIVGVIAVFGFFNLLGVIGRIPTAARRISIGTLFLFGGLLAAQLVCLWGIWEWKKWGVYGMAAIAIASPFVEGALGVATATDWIAPFIQIGILYFLIKDKWGYYE